MRRVLGSRRLGLTTGEEEGKERWGLSGRLMEGKKVTEA